MARQIKDRLNSQKKEAKSGPIGLEDSWLRAGLLRLMVSHSADSEIITNAAKVKAEPIDLWFDRALLSRVQSLR